LPYLKNAMQSFTRVFKNCTTLIVLVCTTTVLDIFSKHQRNFLYTTTLKKCTVFRFELLYTSLSVIFFKGMDQSSSGAM